MPADVFDAVQPDSQGDVFDQVTPEAAPAPATPSITPEVQRAVRRHRWPLAAASRTQRGRDEAGNGRARKTVK